MEFKGKITKVMPIKSGVSKSSGKDYQTQDYVLEWSENDLPKKIMFNIFGGDKIDSYGIQAGDEVIVDLSFDVREWNDKYFNSISCNHCQKVVTNSNTMTFEAPGSGASDNPDDLPF